MVVVVITPPAPVVTVNEAKKHLLVEHDDDNDIIDAFIAAATAWLDGPAGWLGRALGRQVLELRLCAWPCSGWKLPFPPEVEIVSIKYIDPSGVEQTWPVSPNWQFDNLPAVRGQPGDIKIQYRAGYEAVPAPIKVAILMLVSQWYRTRDAVVIGAPVETVPFAVDALLSPYRVYS